MMKIKKKKAHKKMCHKKKLKFQDYKNCLEVAQVERKIKPFKNRVN